jgi:ribosomal protein L7/L12
MTKCPFCDHKNPVSAERCESCGVWLRQGDEPTTGPTGRPTGESVGVDPTPGDLEDRVRSLLSQGRKIEAIKEYRGATGAGLKAAKDAVEALERGQPLPTPGTPDDLEQQLLPLLVGGQKIPAIKLYRERTGAGLKESKDAVEALARRHGLAPKGAGCAGVVALLLGIAGAGVVLIGLGLRWLHG